MISKSGGNTGFLFPKCQNKYVKSICWYLLLLLVAMFVASSSGRSTALLWILNLIAYVLTIARHCDKAESGVWAIASVYLLFGLVSTLINAGYLSEDLKTIGMHVNLIIAPLYMVFFSNMMHSADASEEDVTYLFWVFSALGTVALVLAWLMGFGDLLNVLQGSLGAYRADVDGIFNNKNTYGIFVSLTFCADLYLYRCKRTTGRFLLILVKLVGITLSFSRAALLQALLAGFLFFWFERKRALREWLILLVLIVAFVYAYSSSSSIQLFVDSQLLRLDIGDAGRNEFRNQALSIMPSTASNLLFGIGYAGVSELSVDIDNTYYYEFFSGGIIRVLFFVAIVLVPFALSRKMVREGAASNALASICLAVHFSYLVYMFFESIAPLELGIINFSFMLFSYVVPCMLAQSNRLHLDTRPSYDF